MKITTWNIRQGWWNRLEKIYKTIAEDNNDIIIITEYRSNKEPLFLKNYIHYDIHQSFIHTQTRIKILYSLHLKYKPNSYHHISITLYKYKLEIWKLSEYIFHNHTRRNELLNIYYEY